MSDTNGALRVQVRGVIRDAFAGVRLGDGISFVMAELIDDWKAPALADWRGPEREEDWASLSADRLERADNIAHLDAEGLRYYLPALLLHLLDHYDPGEMWTIGTIAALDQRDRHPAGFLDLLTPTQRRAIAVYVQALPGLVELDFEDAPRIERAFRDVWSHEIEAKT